MNHLNNRPETQHASSQQAASQSTPQRRGMNFLTRIGLDYSIPGFSRSQASAIEDMRAVLNQPQMDDAQETNTGSWEKILNNWANSWSWSGFQERSHRKIAAARINDCIIKNGEHLNLSNLKLSSLPPVLHHCKALKRLDCYNNRLTQLNLDGCKALTELSCNQNQLTQLNIEGCQALTKLNCNHNQLAQLNLEGCQALNTLNCNHNQLTQLNIEGCKALKYVYCEHNPLTQLTLESCKALEGLYCKNNQLTQLTLEGCKALKYVYCEHSPLTQLNLKGCKALEALCCSNNNQLRFDHLDFLLEMEDLRHIECSNTAIRWHQFPAAIRNNPAIFIDIRPQHERLQALNDAQNTHVQSIHRCASQNAKALKENNSTQNLEQAYSDFCTWIKQRPTDGAAILEGYANDHFKNLTAKDWIANPRHLEHKDETSGVSVKEFLVLAWLAAKDPAQREPHISEADAKEVLVNALYEIRRGYNLDDAHTPKDDGKDARNICAGGTFNKISEKLVSVIQGTASVMVTTETFQLSLASTLKNAVEALRKDNLGVDDELKDNDNVLTAHVWEIVKEDVIASIKEEFKDYPKIAGKDLDEHIREQTDYDQVLQYFSVS